MKKKQNMNEISNTLRISYDELFFLSLKKIFKYYYSATPKI